ncbi:hypothetical protein OGAPHI_001524 [Ogataea philodendri]|uniref:C2H2-type domain-containing protein n=1 Tax=Ogataea philodendri TaxID=1378263 RepID=A0A9P8PBV8_9ASCO|nr:uncharacterized protein OGAPHI_001524 [Ogataea philodendri]KAH3669403.1 hypothetical protein OGAPHI_001524 [Ogataea philodendri]
MSEEKAFPTWQAPYDQHNFPTYHHQLSQEPNYVDPSQASPYVPYVFNYPQQLQYSPSSPFPINHGQPLAFNNQYQPMQSHYSYQSPNYLRHQDTPDTSYSEKPGSATTTTTTDLILDDKRDEDPQQHPQHPFQFQMPPNVSLGWPMAYVGPEDRLGVAQRRSRSFSTEDAQLHPRMHHRGSLPKNIHHGSSESKLSSLEQLQKDPSLWELLKSVQKKGGSYRCSHCTEKFSTVEQFILHLDKFKLVRSNKCPVKDCPYRIIGLPRKPELMRHCLSQHSETLENLLKVQRGVELDGVSMSSSLAGDSNDDPGRKKLNVCTREGCGKKFRRKDSLQRHERLVHENQNSRFNQRLRMQKTILGDDLDEYED